MATYFKYAERSAESQINWAEVGKNMTDMLQEQERIRDEKISALDAATRELGEKLANPLFRDQHRTPRCFKVTRCRGTKRCSSQECSSEQEVFNG